LDLKEIELQFRSSSDHWSRLSFIIYGDLNRLMFRLHNRPNGENMHEVEVAMFCHTLRLVWHLCNDYSTGLAMIVDFFNEKMSTEALKQVDAETRKVLTNIGTCSYWRNNPIDGPKIAAAAASVAGRMIGNRSRWPTYLQETKRLWKKAKAADGIQNTTDRIALLLSDISSDSPSLSSSKKKKKKKSRQCGEGSQKKTWPPSVSTLW